MKRLDRILFSKDWLRKTCICCQLLLVEVGRSGVTSDYGIAKPELQQETNEKGMKE